MWMSGLNRKERKMADIKWIKIVTDIFDDEKILLIESMPEADAMIVIWFKLLCLAGKTNNSGVFMMTERLYYTDEMLSTIFRRNINTIRLALKTFEGFGMIEVVNNIITIPKWDKHQNIDGLDKIREQTRKRVALYRENQKQLTECSATVTQGNATEQEQEQDKRKEKIFVADSDESKLSLLLKSLILKNNPTAKVPVDLNKWSAEIEKMIRIHKRDPADIKKVIEFSQRSSFWKSNILSTSKLRDKYDQLFLQAQEPKKQKNDTSDEMERWVNSE